jgi:hypothetical protein
MKEHSAGKCLFPVHMFVTWLVLTVSPLAPASPVNPGDPGSPCLKIFYFR